MYLRPLFILALILPGLCHADSTLIYGNDVQPGSETIIQVKSGDVLMGDRDSKILFKDGKQEIVMIDHPSKTYMVMNEETAKRLEQQMGAAQQQMSAMMQQMQQQMENLSDEQRAQLQAAMGNHMPAVMAKAPVKTTVEQQGQDTVAGVTCMKLLVLVNDKPSGDVCVARAGVLSLDTKDYDSMVNATDTVRKFIERVTGMNDNDAVSMNLRAMKGIPVRMRDLVDGDISVLKSRSSAELNAGLFQVPDGYQKRDMFQ
jgi:K+/H+ antiporter YhaU regulatory subunit KhtT